MLNDKHWSFVTLVIVVFHILCPVPETKVVTLLPDTSEVVTLKKQKTKKPKKGFLFLNSKVHRYRQEFPVGFTTSSG